MSNLTQPGLIQNEIISIVENFRWEKTSLGQKKHWSETLQSTVNLCLYSQTPMLVLCGSEMVIIHNEAFAGMIGQQGTAIIGARASEIWKDKWSDIAPVLSKVFEKPGGFVMQDLYSLFGKGKSRDQKLVSFSLCSVFYRPSKIEAVLISASDTGEAQTPRNSTEERYHRMMEEILDYAIILMDREGIIQNWNKGAEMLMHYKESEAIGIHFRTLYSKEDLENLVPEKLLAEAIINGRANHDGWRLRKDGSKFWGSMSLTALHDEENNVIGFSKVTRDLSDRKKIEDQLYKFTQTLQQRNDALRMSEERYHKMIEEVQDYAIILLSENGEIENWNAGAEKIKGYSAKEIVGKNFRIFYPQEDRDKKFPESLLNQAAVNGRAMHEGWRVRKDGTKFWGSIVITALHRSDGKIIGFSKVTRDLTERKLSEDKMRGYLLELESQNRELEQFAYVASHDLQEPLRKIRTFTEVIERNFDNEEIVKRYFHKINASARRMTELIQSVLNYSRLSKDFDLPDSTDLNMVLANVTADFELLIQEKKAVIISEILPGIKAIPLQINQLFSNLINNALKFSEGAPHINISSRIVSYNQILNPPGPIDKIDYLELSFTDNGIGFDQQYEKLIFTMFQRLNDKQKFTGTGIGLAVCKKIVDFHNGFITAESQVSKGTTFRVYLPANIIIPDL